MSKASRPTGQWKDWRDQTEEPWKAFVWLTFTHQASPRAETVMKVGASSPARVTWTLTGSRARWLALFKAVDRSGTRDECSVVVIVTETQQ